MRGAIVNDDRTNEKITAQGKYKEDEQSDISMRSSTVRERSSKDDQALPSAWIFQG
jgi:hypothetical protein